MALTGGWRILDIKACDLPEKVASGFSEVFAGMVGATYIPVVYCATQVVAGINHMILCKQTLATKDTSEAIVKVILHEQLPVDGGKFSLLNIENIVKGY
jgi:formate-dependent nitrite reductase membrane component NrfD